MNMAQEAGQRRLLAGNCSKIINPNVGKFCDNTLEGRHDAQLWCSFCAAVEACEGGVGWTFGRGGLARKGVEERGDAKSCASKLGIRSLTSLRLAVQRPGRQPARSAAWAG